jgi:hypothetical protein
MPTNSPIWTDPKYRQFFRGAEETIQAEQRPRDRPWHGARESWFHNVILEICGASADEPFRLHAVA